MRFSPLETNRNILVCLLAFHIRPHLSLHAVILIIEFLLSWLEFICVLEPLHDFVVKIVGRFPRATPVMSWQIADVGILVIPVKTRRDSLLAVQQV